METASCCDLPWINDDDYITKRHVFVILTNRGGVVPLEIVVVTSPKMKLVVSSALGVAVSRLHFPGR